MGGHRHARHKLTDVVDNIKKERAGDARREVGKDGLKVGVVIWSEVCQNACDHAKHACCGNVVLALSDNGGEKFEVGQQTMIHWRAAGLTQNQTVALMDVGSTTAVDNWLANAYQTVSYTTTSFTNTVMTTGVSDPAPQSVYQTYAYSGYTIGDKLAWQLPVPDGEYTLRLHFVKQSK